VVGGRPTLTQRNRERAREEVARVAVRLFDRRGFDAVSVDEIAQRAGVSRRTLFRYFASKEDLVFHGHERVVGRLRELLARDEGSSELEHLARVLREVFAGPRDAHSRAVARLVAAVPALQARSAHLAHDFERAVADHLRSRGHETARAEVLAGACIGAVTAARRLATAEAGGAGRLIDEAMAVLAGGWPRLRRRAEPAAGGKLRSRSPGTGGSPRRTRPH
jgi:AcrR family transcriptional regulator